MSTTAARHANEMAETRAVNKSTVHASFQPHSLVSISSARISQNQVFSGKQRKGRSDPEELQFATGANLANQQKLALPKSPNESRARHIPEH